MEAPEPTAKDNARRLASRALFVLAVVAVVVYGLDQLTKYLVVENLPLGQPVPFIGELLQLRFVKNSGAAFSLGSGVTWIFSLVAAGVVVFLVASAHRIRSITWAVVFGMLLGGTLGNLTDRLFREPSFGQGHVIDFLQLYAFPAIFNIADIGIVSSMALFIVLTLRGTGLDGTRPAREAPRARSASEEE
ncbi:signal peptidase II [Diaminobutyricimonas aerilata]|uniref:Lipoprotein signal peptidase n=1 Tax=Diaminobutyricimonas aerilata TaxID=1162967 RepID=A0A2M9CKH0_9MICO|nr:signal peptidase II [Diaminobutyricimonas aerilata]PJJ72378.1 signal peptidase II [Diaminobutyricimonas aerilata]